MTHIIGYDSWKLQNPEHYDYEDAPKYCMECDTEYDDGELCHCHCQDCGEELPEADDAHCQNCCECDFCNAAYEAIEKHHEKTGVWLDNPVITGEKVYSN